MSRQNRVRKLINLDIKKYTISKRIVGLERITPKYAYISMYARKNNTIVNDVLETFTFVLAYPTILRYKPFTLKAMELRYISTLCGSSSGKVLKYLLKLLYQYWCTLPDDDPQTVETCQSSNYLIVKTLYCNRVRTCTWISTIIVRIKIP